MAQLLIPEILSEIGLFITETGQAIGLGETASGVVAGFGVSQITGAINEKLEDAGEYLIGEENVKNIQNTFNDLYKQSQAIYSQDPMGFLKVQQEQKRREKERLQAEKQQVERKALESPLPQTSAKDLADFVVDFSSNLASQAYNGNVLNAQDALSKTVGSSDTRKQLAGVLGSYLADKIPDNETYRKISGMYNGSNMSIENNIKMYFDPEKKLKFFELTDELGETKIMYQTTGFIIPAIHGYFMGAYSQNNELPIDLVDLFSAFHDETYINGPSLQGDYQYISRLSQNFSRMTEEEKPFARMGIVYFSTMGNLVSKLFGDVNITEPKPVEQYTVPISTNQTIFHVLNPDITQDPGVVNSNEQTFKKEFTTEIKNAQAQNSIMSSASPTFRTDVLAREFGNIMIQLI